MLDFIFDCTVISKKVQHIIVKTRKAFGTKKVLFICTIVMITIAQNYSENWPDQRSKYSSYFFGRKLNVPFSNISFCWFFLFICFYLMRIAIVLTVLAWSIDYAIQYITRLSLDIRLSWAEIKYSTSSFCPTSAKCCMYVCYEGAPFNLSSVTLAVFY